MVFRATPGQARFFEIRKMETRLEWSQSLIFPPRHERLGVGEHTRPACRFDQLDSGRASVVHRCNEVGLLPARASRASTSETLHARRVCSFTMSQYQPGVRSPHPRPQTEPHLQKPFQSVLTAQIACSTNGYFGQDWFPLTGETPVPLLDFLRSASTRTI